MYSTCLCCTRDLGANAVLETLPIGRRLRNGLAVGAMAVGTAGFIVGHQLLLPILTGGIGLPNLFNVGYNLHLRRRVLVRVPVENGVGGVVTRAQAMKASLTRGSSESWGLWLPAYAGARGGFATGWRSQEIRLTGRRAIDLLGKIMPRFNTTGGTRKRVREAVDLIEARPPLDNPAPGRLREMDRTVRLALEMAAHEETERHALAGELHLLERQWQEAEAVAKIADALAVSDDVDREMEKRKSVGR